MKIEQINKIAMTESVVRSILGAVPSIGVLMTEALYDYRFRLRQDRLNQFTEQLKEVIIGKDATAQISDRSISDRISDLVEQVLLHVSRTSAKEKHRRFAHVLLDGLAITEKPDFEEQFLSLILELNEVQLQILDVHAKFPSTVNESFQRLGKEMVTLRDLNSVQRREHDSKNKGYANNSDRVDSEVRELKRKVERMQAVRNDSMKLRGEQFYGLSRSDYEILTYSLIGRGLMIDIGVINGEFKPAEILSITAYGLRFLEYLGRPNEVK